MKLDKITESNIQFLFDSIKGNFESGELHNIIEPNVHTINLLNKISIYFHMSDLSLIDIFYLNQFLGTNLKIFPMKSNSQNKAIKIAQFDVTNMVSEIQNGKKFKTVIHLTANSLMMIMNGRPYSFFDGFFRFKEIPSALDENHNGNFKMSDLLDYAFHVFYNKFIQFVNNFITESDLLVDSTIFSNFYSKLNKSNTDVILNYIDTENGLIYDKSKSNSSDDEFVFSINSSFLTFLTLTSFYLKLSNLLDFKDFKLINCERLKWIDSVISLHPNKIKLYQNLNDSVDRFKKSKSNHGETLNRYSYLVGCYDFSYSIKLSKMEISELKSIINSIDEKFIENSEIKIILNKIFSLAE